MLGAKERVGQSHVNRPSLKRTAQYWNQQQAWQVGRGLHWTEVSAVLRRLNVKVSGDPKTDWITYTLNTHLAGRLPLERCLSLGCGRGWLERQLAGMGAFEACDAYDVAPDSIDEARQLAAAQGYQHIHYAVADINHLELPAQAYDMVWVSGAIHHFERLEHVCAQIQQGLKPQGLLVLNEYVGPSRFQFPVRQREVLQAALTLLPRRYRRLAPQCVKEALTRSPMRRGLRWTVERLWDKLRDGHLLATLHRRWEMQRASRSDEGAFVTKLYLPTTRDVIAADPSEAVRSAEILDMVSRFFTFIECKDLGGTLLQFLLDGIAVNFDDNDPQAVHLLELLFQIEDTLLNIGDLQSDFVYLVAKPKCEDMVKLSQSCKAACEGQSVSGGADVVH